MKTSKNLFRNILKILTWIIVASFIITGIFSLVLGIKADEVGLGILMMLGMWIIGFLLCIYQLFYIETADNIAATTDSLVMISNQLAIISDKMNQEINTRHHAEPNLPQNERIGSIPNAVVEVVSGSLTGQKVSLVANQIITIGRDPACCQFILQSNGISRKHCTIFYNGMTSRFVVTDYSTNGTYVNGNRINSGVPVEVQVGSRITLGRTNEAFVLR